MFSLRLKEMFKLKKAGDFKVCSIFFENLTSWRDYLPFITRYNHSFRTEADFNVPNCIFDVKLTSKKNNNKKKNVFVRYVKGTSCQVTNNSFVSRLRVVMITNTLVPMTKLLRLARETKTDGGQI